MHGAQVERMHLCQQCWRRRRSSNGHRNLFLDTVCLGMVHQENLDSRSAIIMCHALFLEEIPYQTWFDLAQTDMSAACSRHGPSTAPAVTMKHRQRPHIHTATIESRLDHFGQSTEISSSMRRYYTFGIAGGTGSVINSNVLFLIF